LLKVKDYILLLDHDEAADTWPAHEQVSDSVDGNGDAIVDHVDKDYQLQAAENTC
jgi:hypothetical protein